VVSDPGERHPQDRPQRGPRRDRDPAVFSPPSPGPAV